MTAAAAFGVAALLAAAGWRVRWLAPSGAATAVVVGGTILWGSGLAGGALLALFFLSGSFLTYTTGITRDWMDRRERAGRAARQVAANGGWAALGATLVPSDPHLGWAVLAGSLAAAQADTWATEIGARAARPPRLLTSMRIVAPGTSGGVTLLGTVGGAAGAAVIAAAALLVTRSGGMALATFAGGVAGMLFDSLLGASVQAMFRCERCGVETEHARHQCGGHPTLVRGMRWIGNNAVNLACAGVGAGVAAGLVGLGG